MEISINECFRKNTCYDCDNQRCWHHGKKEADCPKYRCDRSIDERYDCDHCSFIDKHIQEMQAYYAGESTE